MWGKPRKLNVSGFPRPRRSRRSAAKRQNSIRRVLSGCSDNLNFSSRSRRSARKRLASVLYSKMFSAAQLRVFLRALATIDPYAFDDIAEQLAANDENNQQTSEEILLSTIDGLPVDKLTVFALRLVLTAHTPIPREGELDLLTEAETAFAPLQPKKT